MNQYGGMDTMTLCDLKWYFNVHTCSLPLVQKPDFESEVSFILIHKNAVSQSAWLNYGYP